MKKLLAISLCLVVALGLLSGCGNEKRIGEASNDILTYQPIDPKRTTLIVSKTGNTDISHMNEAFMEKNPDVQVVTLDITGGDSYVRPFEDWIIHGFSPDVAISDASLIDVAYAEKYFENLSASPVISNFQMEALNKVAVNANIFWLPGPSKIDCMIYNKTLFDNYGWQVPKTFDEFVALCVKIREDTGGEVQPWNPNAKYFNEFNTVVEGFVYAELFAGVENRTWYNEFLAGRATYAEHMKPYYTMLQKLIDNDILKEEHFSYSATTRGKEFMAGKIAMYNYPVAILDNDQFKFDFMPFPTTVGEDGFICDKISCLLGVPVKERSKALQDAVDRYLAFFSSVEGQQALIGNLLMVSNVKNVPLNQAEHLAALQPVVDQGHMFTLLEFKNDQKAANFSLYSHARSILLGERTAEECLMSVDNMPFVPAQTHSIADKPVIATIAENFTILETSAYFADAYREKAGADIGLIVNNIAYRGNLMRIFKGDLTENHVTVLKPRSLDNKSTLVKASMTGEQLLGALNKPYGYDAVADAVYAFSGLKCKVAPWKALGERMVEVTLSGGEKIEPDKLYTVAFWQGTVYDEFITEILEIYDGTFEQVLTEKLEKDQSIAPAKDGRITLIWN